MHLIYYTKTEMQVPAVKSKNHFLTTMNQVDWIQNIFTQKGVLKKNLSSLNRTMQCGVTFIKWKEDLDCIAFAENFKFRKTEVV